MDFPIESWSAASSVVRGQRDQLLRFWLSCPDDVLEALWSGAPGQATREMVAELSNTTFFTEPQVATRNRLGDFLKNGFHQPGSVKAVIATFLLSPPGQFRIVNPESHLPLWLVPAYRSLYEQGNVTTSRDYSTPPSATSVSPSGVDSSSASERSQIEHPALDFGAFPSTLQEFVANRLQLNRLLGLSNLYYIDPDDDEIRNELLDLRQKLSGLILSANDLELENYFKGDFSDRYWALVRSGIQSVPLDSKADNLKNHVKEKLNPALGGGFGSSGAIQAFLVAMTLYQPGSMQVEDASSKLPSWLLPGYLEIFAKALTK